MESHRALCAGARQVSADASTPQQLPRWRPLLCALFCLLLATRAAATLEPFLAEIAPAELIAGATEYGEQHESLPVIPLLAGGQLAGYAFLNSGFSNSIGYSGKPIHILVAMDIGGVIRHSRLVKHSEPIVLIGIPDSKIKATLAVYQDLNILDLLAQARALPEVDIVSGATVTIMVMDDSIISAAKQVARRLLLGEAEAAGTQRQLDPAASTADNWSTLSSDDTLGHLLLSVEQVSEAFLSDGETRAASEEEDGAPGEPFIDLYLAPVSVPAVGQALLGTAEYANLLEQLQPGEQALLLMASGRYSFRGSGFVRGGIFDRFLVRQGDNSYRFRDLNYKRLGQVATADAPTFDEIGLFRTSADVPLDITKPWQLELLVGRATGATSKAFVTFTLPYQLPEAFMLPAPVIEAEGPLWHKLWLQKKVLIALLLSAMLLLTAAFFFQSALVHYPLLTDRFRVGFLLFTLLVLGWYGNAQLSVVNVLTVVNAWITGFDWQYFLMEPLIFILWGGVAFALLFWGRGAFCGWFCPFGALQELSNRIAKRLQVPQIPLPWGLHERLWAVKYVIFLLLFGVGLHSIELAERMAEVEPFKTAIILKFDRPWPYVLFALICLLPGLFIERFYCRYFCPLGAALAIPGKLRLFEWLKRYKECGSQCQRCAKECMVQSIHPEGQINPNECLYCLHCQVVYFDQVNCYKFVARRKRREQKKERLRQRQLIASDQPP